MELLITAIALDRSARLVTELAHILVSIEEAALNLHSQLASDLVTLPVHISVRVELEALRVYHILSLGRQ